MSQTQSVQSTAGGFSPHEREKEKKKKVAILFCAHKFCCTFAGWHTEEPQLHSPKETNGWCKRKTMQQKEVIL